VSIRRVVVIAVAGALMGAAALAGFYAVDPVLTIDFATDPPRLVRGLHPPERDEASGLTFAWTREDMAVRLPALDRSVDWIMDARLRAARPDPRQNPELAFFADGVHLDSRAAPTDFEHVRVTIPARPERRRGAMISMRTSSTFVPGPSDPRTLGVMVDAITLTPANRVVPPGPAFVAVAAAGAALGAALALTGLPAAAAAAGAVVLSAATAAVVGRGFGLHTGYPETAALIAVWIGAALVILTAAVDRARRQPLGDEARFAIALSAGALFLKLLVVLHPDMPVGDAMFHAHRFQGVLAGNLYFTSIAPGGYLFPYAPGLYVFASPFAHVVARGDADMALLRVLVLSVDAVAAGLLYWMIVRAWQDRTAAVVAVALYLLIPLEFRTTTIGNLTNAFAQSVSVLALALLAAPAVRLERQWPLPLLTLVLATAFMSHTSTFPLLFGACVLTAALFFWSGGPSLRSPALTVLGAAVVAFVLAVAVYYGHFGDTYRAEFSRIGAETAAAAPDAGGRGIGMRAATVPYYLQSYFGIPALLLAAIGAWRLWHRPAQDRLTLATAGWALSCLAFLALGLLTPVDMRYYLAAIPAVAIAGAAGASFLWSREGPARLLAVALLGWVLWTGAEQWWMVLG
jgi:hypothetical protein